MDKVYHLLVWSIGIVIHTTHAFYACSSAFVGYFVLNTKNNSWPAKKELKAPQKVGLASYSMF